MRILADGKYLYKMPHWSDALVVEVITDSNQQYVCLLLGMTFTPMCVIPGGATFTVYTGPLPVGSNSKEQT